MLFRPQVKRKESTDKEFQSLDLDGKKLLTNKTFLTSIKGDKKSSNLVEQLTWLVISLTNWADSRCDFKSTPSLWETTVTKSTMKPQVKCN